MNLQGISSGPSRPAVETSIGCTCRAESGTSWMLVNWDGHFKSSCHLIVGNDVYIYIYIFPQELSRYFVLSFFGGYFFQYHRIE